MTLMHLFTSQITAHAQQGRPMNVPVWSSYYGMDVMADLTYGNSFKLLETGKPNEVWEKMHTQFAPTVGISTVSPWLLRGLMAIPGASVLKKRWYDICENLVQERIKVRISLLFP